MPNQHKTKMIGWHPPADLGAWIRERAERMSTSVSDILTEALSEYRTARTSPPHDLSTETKDES